MNIKEELQKVSEQLAKITRAVEEGYTTTKKGYVFHYKGVVLKEVVREPKPGDYIEFYLEGESPKREHGALTKVLNADKSVTELAQARFSLVAVYEVVGTSACIKRIEGQLCAEVFRETAQEGDYIELASALSTISTEAIASGRTYGPVKFSKSGKAVVKGVFGDDVHVYSKQFNRHTGNVRVFRPYRQA